MSFTTPVDICNRALQHCGVSRITAFTDDSKQAAEVSFCYDKLRRAELRRNIWRFAIRKTVLRPINTFYEQPASTTVPTPIYPTMILNSTPYSLTEPYEPGSIVFYNGVLWITMTTPLIGAAPGIPTSQWQPYFGPLTVDQWSPPQTTSQGAVAITQPTAYYAGELVYQVTPNTNQFNVFLSLINSNANQPILASQWATTTVYRKGIIVQYTDGFYYLSLTDFNLDNIPGADPDMWNNATTYAQGATVTGQDGFVYTSTENGNLNNEPSQYNGIHWPTNGALPPWTTAGVLSNWTKTFLGSTNDNGWLRIPGELTDLVLVYPVGSGPNTQSSTRNVYWLPAGYLREAPQDPKAGSTSYLGAESGRMYDDWDFENQLFTSRENRPIVFRFVTDIQDVTQFDDMFCEGLAARIALEVVETLTQSTAKMQGISSMYQKFMSEARIVNGIETGSTEPPVDDFITCRI